MNSSEDFEGDTTGITDAMHLFIVFFVGEGSSNLEGEIQGCADGKAGDSSFKEGRYFFR